MNDQLCLTSPHHFTYLGVCYVGEYATIQLSDPTDPQPTEFSVTSVPEPSTLALMVVACVVGRLMRGRRLV